MSKAMDHSLWSIRTADPDADINPGKSFLSNDKKWLLEFVLKCLWFNLIEGFSIDLDETFAGFASSDGSGSLLPAVDLDGLDWGGSWHFYIRISKMSNDDVTRYW